MRQTARSTIMATLLAALAGCGSASGADHFVTGTVGAEYAGEVQIVMDGQPQPASETLEEIGLVRAAAYGDVREDHVWWLLRREAASLGADVIVRVRRDQSDMDLVLVGVAARRR